MDERFVPLAAFVRAAGSRPQPSVIEAASAPAAGASQGGVAHASVVWELGLLRLAAIEAYERATRSLLRSLAHDVLARELATAPADVDALARRTLADFARDEPVAIAVSPADAARVAGALPVRIDPALRAGDLVVDVRAGAFESHFALRVEDAIERAATVS